MTEADIRAAVTMWREQGADLPWKEIERALRRLPDSGICAVSDDARSFFMLGPADTLFTVAVDGGELTLSSRPLDADRLVVSLRWSGDTSSWRFAYLGETREREGWQDITGSVALNGGREQLDDREQFARALAARAGWSDGPKLPSATEPAPTGPPAEAGEKEPRWRARTDVWGRPLDVQGR